MHNVNHVTSFTAHAAGCDSATSELSGTIAEKRMSEIETADAHLLNLHKTARTGREIKWSRTKNSGAAIEISPGTANSVTDAGINASCQTKINWQRQRPCSQLD